MKRKLSDIEMICLANMVYLDLKKFKRIYYGLGMDAINIIACNNVYFMINKIKCAQIDDLHHIANVYDKAKGKYIVEELLKENVYIRCDKYYYSAVQLNVIGFSEQNLGDAVERYNCVKRNGSLIMPTQEMLSREHYNRICKGIFRRLNAELPYYISLKINKMPENMYMMNVNLCCRLTHFYLSLDPSCIGFKRFIYRHLKVARKSPKMFMSLIKETGIWSYDRKMNIIYDPEMRLKRGLFKNPDKSEVVLARERCVNKILNLLLQF